MEEVTYEELRRIQQRERSHGALGELPGDFYQRAGGLLDGWRRGLTANFALEKAKEYENALKILKDIYSIRQQKLILRALRTRDVGGVADEERSLFDNIVMALRENEGLLDRAIGQRAQPSPPKNDGRRIKALLEIPAFVGSDGATRGPFKLGEEAQLPPGEAELLAKRNMVQVIE